MALCCKEPYLSLTCGHLCVDTSSSSTAAREGQSIKRRPGFQPRSHPSAGWALKDEMQMKYGLIINIHEEKRKWDWTGWNVHIEHTIHYKSYLPLNIGSLALPEGTSSTHPHFTTFLRGKCRWVTLSHKGKMSVGQSGCAMLSLLILEGKCDRI